MQKANKKNLLFSNLDQKIRSISGDLNAVQEQQYESQKIKNEENKSQRKQKILQQFNQISERCREIKIRQQSFRQTFSNQSDFVLSDDSDQKSKQQEESRNKQTIVDECLEIEELDSSEYSDKIQTNIITQKNQQTFASDCDNFNYIAEEDLQEMRQLELNATQNLKEIDRDPHLSITLTNRLTKNNCAIFIQKVWKGYQTRKILKYYLDYFKQQFINSKIPDNNPNNQVIYEEEEESHTTSVAGKNRISKKNKINQSYDALQILDNQDFNESQFRLSQQQLYEEQINKGKQKQFNDLMNQMRIQLDQEENLDEQEKVYLLRQFQKEQMKLLFLDEDDEEDQDNEDDSPQIFDPQDQIKFELDSHDQLEDQDIIQLYDANGVEIDLDTQDEIFDDYGMLNKTFYGKDKKKIPRDFFYNNLLRAEQLSKSISNQKSVEFEQVIELQIKENTKGELSRQQNSKNSSTGNLTINLQNLDQNNDYIFKDNSGILDEENDEEDEGGFAINYQLQNPEKSDNSPILNNSLDKLKLEMDKVEYIPSQSPDEKNQVEYDNFMQNMEIKNPDSPVIQPQNLKNIEKNDTQNIDFNTTSTTQQLQKRFHELKEEQLLKWEQMCTLLTQIVEEKDSQLKVGEATFQLQQIKQQMEMNRKELIEIKTPQIITGRNIQNDEKKNEQNITKLDTQSQNVTDYMDLKVQKTIIQKNDPIHFLIDDRSIDQKDIDFEFVKRDVLQEEQLMKLRNLLPSEQLIKEKSSFSITSPNDSDSNIFGLNPFAEFTSQKFQSMINKEDISSLIRIREEVLEKRRLASKKIIDKLFKSSKISPRTFQKKKGELEKWVQIEQQNIQKTKKEFEKSWVSTDTMQRTKRDLIFRQKSDKKKYQSLSEDENLRQRLTLSSESNTSSANHFKQICFDSNQSHPQQDVDLFMPFKNFDDDNDVSLDKYPISEDFKNFEISINQNQLQESYLNAEISIQNLPYQTDCSGGKYFTPPTNKAFILDEPSLPCLIRNRSIEQLRFSQEAYKDDDGHTPNKEVLKDSDSETNLLWDSDKWVMEDDQNFNFQKIKNKNDDKKSFSIIQEQIQKVIDIAIQNQQGAEKIYTRQDIIEEQEKNLQVDNLTDFILDILFDDFQKEIDNNLSLSINMQVSEIISNKNSLKNQQQKVQKLVGIQTNVQSIKDYLLFASNLIKRQYMEQFNNFINIPLGPQPVEMLKFLHVNDDNQSHSVIENSNDSLFLHQAILSTEIYQDIEKKIQEQQPRRKEVSKEQDFLQELEHIHNKVIFDSFNESLDSYRIFGLYGKPFPWKISSSRIKETHISLQQCDSVINKAQLKVIDWASCLVGLLFDKDNQKIHFDRHVNEDYINQIKEDRLSRMLAQGISYIQILIDVIENEERWIIYDDEQTEICVELSEQVSDQLILEFIREIQNQNSGQYLI